MKPPRRRQVWGGRRARLLRAIVFLGALGYAVHRVGDIMGKASAFHIERIVVHGNERLSSGEVLAVLGGLRGRSILLADLDGWRLRLLHSAWVRDAALRRVLPSTVEVVVSERVPIGIARLDGHLYLVDGTGAIIDDYGPQYAEFDLPIIDGLSAATRDGGAIIDERRAHLAARLLDSVEGDKELARRLSQVDVSDARDGVVILESDPALIHLGEDRFRERLQSYVELASALHARVARIDYVDMRFEDRVYVRPIDTTAEGRRSPDSKRTGADARPKGVH